MPSGYPASREAAVQRYVDQALGGGGTAEGAMRWLAVYIANEAAALPTYPRRRPRAVLLEAYRRVRAQADAEFAAEVANDA
jgi:hypothetical protein